MEACFSRDVRGLEESDWRAEYLEGGRKEGRNEREGQEGTEGKVGR
jgi:hypothetical protein